ncbi:MAG: DUF2249 domain-containing protein [Paraburkholderia sp.]|nr:MAG: DUF2249 domain-containing protein [Paraburkholderia sp.]TAM28654.1 MAG: DUF2249 domain-containing protein [Paraburkholderia sp.]
MTVTQLNVFQFDARGIAKRFRHAAIFGALESLEQGDTMRFINDHDPLPLLNQIQQRYGNQVRIQYVERGAQGVVIDMVIAVTGEEAATSSQSSSSGSGCGCGAGGAGCGS